MDQMQAAQALGVAAYTIVDLKYHFERGGWVVKVRDMASHDIVERFLPGEFMAPLIETAVGEPQDDGHGPALVELAEEILVPDDTVQGVVEWVGTDTARARAALAAEQRKDKPRKTLVEVLQAHVELAELADQ